MELTEVQIRYLLTMLHLLPENDIRLVDIAAAMNDAGPTAYKRLDSLIQLGLITKRRYRSMQFTDEGLDVARKLKEQYDTIYLFFHQLLGLDGQESGESAFAFLGNLSRRSIGSLEQYVRTRVTG